MRLGVVFIAAQHRRRIYGVQLERDTRTSHIIQKNAVTSRERAPLVKLILTAETRDKPSRSATCPREEENARYRCGSASLGGDGKPTHGL
jgi:hypothetical protein